VSTVPVHDSTRTLSGAIQITYLLTYLREHTNVLHASDWDWSCIKYSNIKYKYKYMYTGPSPV